MTDEEIVAALAEGLWGDEDDRRRQAVKLLPTVRRVAVQWAAAELLAAVEDVHAALTATPNHGTDATS